MSDIIVSKKEDKGGVEIYDVDVSDSGSSASFVVRVTSESQSRFLPEGFTSAELVEESFRFLLEREPKESILSNFEISTIEGYFPEYPERISERLKSAG